MALVHPSVLSPIQSSVARVDGVLGLSFTQQAFAAFSVRDIGVGALGAVMRVKRDSDNAEQDFTATQITDGTLTTFTGTGGSDNGYVHTWYDQTGNGRHMTSSGTLTRNPHIVKAGVLLDGPSADVATSNGTMQYAKMSEGSSDLAQGGTKVSMAWVGKIVGSVTAASGCVVAGALRGVNSYQNGGIGFQIIKAGNDNWKFINEREGSADESDGVSTGATASINTDDYVVATGGVDVGTYFLNVNATSVTFTDSDTVELDGTQGLGIFGAFANNGNSYYQRSTSGTVKECYYFSGNSASSSNMTKLHSDLDEHYDIF